MEQKEAANNKVLTVEQQHKEIIKELTELRVFYNESHTNRSELKKKIDSGKATRIDKLKFNMLEEQIPEIDVLIEEAMQTAYTDGLLENQDNWSIKINLNGNWFNMSNIYSIDEVNSTVSSVIDDVIEMKVSRHVRFNGTNNTQYGWWVDVIHELNDKEKVLAKRIA